MCSIFPWQHGISYLFCFGVKVTLTNSKLCETYSRVHKISLKNIYTSLKFYEMGYEATKWPRSDLRSFKIGAPDHME
jgi:hypothetical protein